MSKIQYSDVLRLSADKKFIIGIDECGYGALAGPLVVCAARTPRLWSWPKLDDSKKLTEKRRKSISAAIKESGQITYSIAFYEANKLDTFSKDNKNMGDALRELYATAIAGLDQTDSLIVLDGVHKIPDVCHISLPKADGLVQATSAASVIAKVYRDNRMVELAKFYPNYGFEDHKGYGSKFHMDALKKFGPCAIHRFCYEPIKSMVR